jgi:hypothetical protein
MGVPTEMRAIRLVKSGYCGGVAALIPGHAGCPIRNFLRVRGSADQRARILLRTGSGQVVHDNVRVPDEIRKDLRAQEGRVHSVDTMCFSVSARPGRRGRHSDQVGQAVAEVNLIGRGVFDWLAGVVGQAVG